MKLVVLGANGRTGEKVVREALDRGTAVTAVVRSDAKRPEIRHDLLSVAVGDPCDTAFLACIFCGQDAIISALGGRRPTKKATSIYYASADAIVGAASQAGIRKVLVTSSALLFPPKRPLDRLLKVLVPNVVRSAIRMEHTLRGADLDVVVARCGFLTDSTERRYRAESGALPVDGSFVARLSLAAFLVDMVFSPWSGYQVYGVSGPR
jgi:nucleoside-diphosphate-sugar epimerase